MPSIRQLPHAVLRAILAAAVLLSAVLLGAAPASAHDAVGSTSPADGASVPVPPQQVELTMSEPPLALGTQVKVSDGAGTNWADGAVEIQDNVVSQKLKEGAPAGAFTVQWRVSSSDGHPVEGTFTFTAAAPASGSTTPATSPAAGTAPAAGNVPTLGTAQPGTTVAPTPAPDASQPFPWSIVIFVAVAVGILVALGLMAKRRLDDRGGDDGARAGSAPGEGPRD
ncbi:copper resistance CopC family protein [Arthrobacter sp. Hor0625]|uniref:copper resistance CopC family protein n=1 Tax=Arthrobacter sp. Hor0625 TaxID=3457358 RepID=UPI00403E586E